MWCVMFFPLYRIVLADRHTLSTSHAGSLSLLSEASARWGGMLHVNLGSVIIKSIISARHTVSLPSSVGANLGKNQFLRAGA